jgi:hypothetical protein
MGSNTHILSARRRSTPPCPSRRGSGFVQSTNEIARFGGLKPPIPAISNAAATEKLTPAQSLRALFTDDEVLKATELLRIFNGEARNTGGLKPLA